MNNYIVEYLNRKLRCNYVKYKLKYNTKQKKVIEYTINNKYYIDESKTDMAFKWLVGCLALSFASLLSCLFVTLITSTLWCTIVLIILGVLIPIMFAVFSGSTNPFNKAEFILSFFIGLIGYIIGLILMSVIIKYEPMKTSYPNFLINHLLW